MVKIKNQPCHTAWMMKKEKNWILPDDGPIKWFLRNISGIFNKESAWMMIIPVTTALTVGGNSLIDDISFQIFSQAEQYK